ncbi:uncharacterized protein LOC115096719 isoform X2 [Rhinatrema bivittatum]|uniref:uncharacterized protein LOC115096719 isoform X2 n=1 Tax=Rhinatrema bivittatum TaxID=194408 RepID=UPI00112C21B7|nr:uncharacterized protein LOC115096719 isoform X2 [Rhinatrema bivittatum]
MVRIFLMLFFVCISGIWMSCSFLLMISLEEAASQSCPAKCKFCSVTLAECEHVSSLNSGLKYFETQHEENVMDSEACSDVPPPASDTLEIAVYHPESMMQINANNRDVGQKITKRSKTWNTLYGFSNNSTEIQEEAKCDGNEAHIKELEVTPMSLNRERAFIRKKYEENFQGEEHMDSLKNGRSIDLSDEDSISEKELVRFFCSKDYFSSESNESCDEGDEGLEDVETNWTPMASSQSTPTILQKPKNPTKGRVTAHKGSKMTTSEIKLSSPYLEKESIKQKSICDAYELGNERLRHKKRRSKKIKQGFSLSSDRLTGERFWKYHTNCCDEYKPCATAKKVLKYIKTAPLEQLDNESIQNPPSDLDLLQDQTTSLPLPPTSINDKETSFKLQSRMLQNKNCMSLPNLTECLAIGGLHNVQKQLKNKNISCGAPHFIQVKPAPQVDSNPQEPSYEPYAMQTAAEPGAEKSFDSVDLMACDQCDLPESSMARQIIHVCNAFGELSSSVGNKIDVSTSSDCQPTEHNSKFLLTQIACTSEDPFDSGKGKIIKTPAVSHTDSPINTCLQLSKVAFSKIAVTGDETFLQNAKKVPEYSKPVYQDICMDITRSPPQHHWLDNINCDNEYPCLLVNGKSTSLPSCHSDKLLALENGEDWYKSQRNAGIVQLNETEHHIFSALMANELRPRDYSEKMPHGNYTIKNNSVLASMNCSNKMPDSHACNPTDHPHDTNTLYEKGFKQPDEFEDYKSEVAILCTKPFVSMSEPQKLRYITHNESGHINDEKYSNPNCEECLIHSKDQLFYLSEDNTEGRKGLKQSLNDYRALKLSRRTYHSVFKLPVGSTPREGPHQSEDHHIPTHGVKQRPSVPESERYKMKTSPSPNSLNQEAESRLALNSKSEELAMQSAAKTTYVRSLYKAKPQRKLIYNFFQKMALPDVNELSVLSNLHFCKIAGELTLSMKEREGTEQFQGDEGNAPPDPSPSSNSGQYEPPTRQELSADSELSLIRMLCSLKLSLEHSGTLQKQNNMDP